MDSDSPYAILRVEKVKSYAALAAMANHWFRLNPTPNADSSRSHLNKTLIGDNNIVSKIKTRLDEHGIKKLRKNGVLALEFVLTFSPEFVFQNDKREYRSDANKRVSQWAKQSLAWAKSAYGENLISAVIHLDESTPHIHLCVLPLKPKKGGKYGLCARDITGGKVKLQAMQDSYHNELKGLGLQRGKKRARCKHQTIKDYHNAVQTSLIYIKQAGLSHPESIGKVNPYMYAIDKLKTHYEKKITESRTKSTSIIKQLLEIIHQMKRKLNNESVKARNRRI
ncbi:MobV family relaxase [Alteromonas sp. C1M14]|uniref:MobV family relaxase n=1 Tax=Alteromonas sp. C1M14 TaxID=2841567 RepID=UPI001C08B6A5|nr:MobV family relaxase [Alteromonas sp. C1M14]MBU2979732.1 plasmid recombination protein [Alteromonas sp. C1M14]